MSIKFPGHEEQVEIAEGFRTMSGASFDQVVGAIDGILIWTVNPSKKECKHCSCGDKRIFLVEGSLILASICRLYATMN